MITYIYIYDNISLYFLRITKFSHKKIWKSKHICCVQRLEAAQMKFLRHLLGITKLDKEKNQCIRQNTGVQNIVKEIKQYQKKWLQHVRRMDTNRLPKQALQYKPKGRRNIGRPRKRWRDQLHLEDQGTGSTPNPSGTWWWWWWYVVFNFSWKSCRVRDNIKKYGRSGQVTDDNTAHALYMMDT